MKKSHNIVLRKIAVGGLVSRFAPVEPAQSGTYFWLLAATSEVRVSDDPKKEPPVAPRGMVAAAGQIGAAVTIGLSGAGAVAAAGEIVVSIRELPQALRENNSPFSLILPQLLPASIALYALTLIANSDGFTRNLVLSFTGLAVLGLLRNYNVEISYTISESGKKRSVLRLTKKNRDEDKK
jgi:hypothetical protein